ncbi:MAG: aminodeoxychorismate lyase [Pseudomonadota bacterium]
MGDAVQVLVNGKPNDCVPTSDRGLLYGDGVFETIAVENGQLQYWSRHLRRLQSGCERLGMESVNETLLEEECRSLIKQSQLAVIKIIITRGSGGRGYRLPGEPRSTRIIQLHAWPDYPASCKEGGVKTRICRTRLGHNSSLAGIKHLNRLEQVLARQEWGDPAIMEGLMLDVGGDLVEGTMSNVFMVQDGVLITPDLQLCGVAGIMRARVLEMAAENSIVARIQRLDQDALLQADEVFVCNSLMGIWPVTGVDKHTFQKGPVTTRLQTLLANT